MKWPRPLHRGFFPSRISSRMTRPIEQFAAWSMGMTDAVWRRHANPWSVWTRVVTLPALVLAVWSRAWIGWWAVLPVAAVLGWTWLNPRVFPEPVSTENWASKAVLGERVWIARKRSPIPARHRMAPHLLIPASLLGVPLLVWGLWALAVWPTVAGFILAAGAKLWFCDRMVWLYEDVNRSGGEAGPPDPPTEP